MRMQRRLLQVNHNVKDIFNIEIYLLPKCQAATSSLMPSV